LDLKPFSPFSLSPLCGSGSEPSSAPPPPLAPPALPLDLDLRDIVLARVSASSWDSVLLRVVMVFSDFFAVYFSGDVAVG
jgi:hypothetical protein